MPRQSRFAGCLLKILAGVVGLVTLIGIGIYAEELKEWPRAVGCAGLFLGIGLVGAILHRSRQHSAPLADEVMARDRRPPVLYLRSFADDPSATGVEEVLAKILGEVGPFIAIGRPGEKLPPLGAARKYVADSEWRGYVDHMLQHAVLVVLRAGKTAGLHWEVQQSTKRLDPRRLVILVPRDKEAWNGFLEQAHRANLRLPAYPGRRLAKHGAGELCGLVCFDHQWRAYFLPFVRAALRGRSYELPNSANRAGPRLRIALRPVYKQLGIRWRKPGFNFVFGCGCGFLVLVLIAIVVVGTLVATGVLEP